MYKWPSEFDAKMHVVKYQLSQAEDVDEDTTNEHGLRGFEGHSQNGYMGTQLLDVTLDKDYHQSF